MTDLNTLRYTTDHEWLAVDGDIVTVGITEYAASQLGDIVFVELPESGTEAEPGASLGEIESTKSVGELFAPVAGEVVEVNQAVIDDPSVVNSDPYDQGWLVKLRVTVELPDTLLDHAGYQALIGGEA